MELEEPEDEEWNTTTCQYLSEEPNYVNNGGSSKVRWMLNRGLTLGKHVLVAGFVASSAPLVVPPLVVASAIGLAISMPYAFFLASHACTQNLMSKLLPRPTPSLLIQQELFFQSDIIDDIDIDKEEQALVDERNRHIEMVQHMNHEKNMTSGNNCGQGVVKKKDESEVLSHSQDGIEVVVIQDNGSKKDNSDYFSEVELEVKEKASPQTHDNVKLGAKIDDGMEGRILRGESNWEQEQPMTVGHGVVITTEGLDNIGNDIEEFKTPFEVTTVAFGDQTIEGDIEQAELQRETKGLLEKIRDEGRTDSRGEYVTNESDLEIGLVVEHMEIDKHSCTTVGTGSDVRKEEDPKVCEEILQSYNEVESAEPVRGMLEGKEVDNTNDSQKPMAELSELLDGRPFLYETTPAEPVGDLLIEMQDYNISLAEDASEVTSERTDIRVLVKEEPKPLLDGPTIQQAGKLDDNISDFVNKESQLHEYNEIMDLSDADAREIADESGFDLFDEKIIEPDAYAYSIDLHEESSNFMVDEHIGPMEVLVSSEEHKIRPSEYSSGKDIMCPSDEVVFNEESIWKQIHVIRKIIGYEGATRASCAEELKALYIFIGVEPPTFLKENTCDPAEINEKLQIIMSIVGIKWNVA